MDLIDGGSGPECHFLASRLHFGAIECQATATQKRQQRGTIGELDIDVQDLGIIQPNPFRVPDLFYGHRLSLSVNRRQACSLILLVLALEPPTAWPSILDGLEQPQSALIAFEERSARMRSRELSDRRKLD
jgi:hypothetical protein